MRKTNRGPRFTLVGALALLALFGAGDPADATERPLRGPARVQLVQSSLPDAFAVPLDDGGLQQVRAMGAAEDGAPGSPRLDDLSIILWDESQGRPRRTGSGGGSGGQTTSTINGQSY